MLNWSKISEMFNNIKSTVNGCVINLNKSVKRGEFRFTNTVLISEDGSTISFFRNNAKARKLEKLSEKQINSEVELFEILEAIKQNL